MEEQQGLILVNTGLGKGKTTASLGTVLRAVGQGLKVLVVQFIKSGSGYGELKALATLGVVVRSMGKGFIYHKKQATPEELAQHEMAAQSGWTMVKNEVMHGAWDLIVLDEINVAMHYGLIDVEDVVGLLQEKPKPLHLILTGRYAPQAIIDMADTVTDMTVIKHAYEKGITAVKGIEF